jgi:DNA-binding transcriptional regulator YiaG
MRASEFTYDVLLVNRSNTVNTTQDMAELVVCLRQRLGLTQEQLAARLGVTCPTVSRWENRRSRPSPIALKLIKSAVEQLDDAEDLLAQYFPDQSFH